MPRRRAGSWRRRASASTREDGQLPKDAKLGPKALYDLLESLNPYMDYEELIELLVIDLLLVGNAYWFKWRTNEKGQPSRCTASRRRSSGDPVGPRPRGATRYTVPGWPAQAAPDPAERHDPLPLPNPHSPYYGLGIVQGGGRPLTWSWP